VQERTLEALLVRLCDNREDQDVTFRAGVPGVVFFSIHDDV
jgi:hypothetical protein